MKNKHNNSKVSFSRRRFLSHAGTAAVASSPLFSSLLTMGMQKKAQAATIPGNDYKALVCVFLAGGNDSFNMLTPYSGSGYTNYSNARAGLAHSKASLQQIHPSNTGGRTFGLHPDIPEIRDLFNDGKLDFVANIGTLVEPTTVSQYHNKSVTLPRQLFSHSDQMNQWETSTPSINSASGWAGRMADLLHNDVNGGSELPMNISLTGNNMMQAGNASHIYSITHQGSVSVQGKNGGSSLDNLRYQEFLHTSQMAYPNHFRQAYANSLSQSDQLDSIFSGAFDSSVINTTFSTHPFAKNLKAIARSIAAQSQLGQRRQVFFVKFGGWDHHSRLLSKQAEMLPILSQSLKAFWDALGEVQMQDNVTTFTVSDFGRSLRSNGSGTDHAWGGNQMVMGNAIKGHSIHGNYPNSLALNQGQDISGHGRLLPTTSTDQYYADLALWFGVSPSDLSDILPNIDNFYDTSSGTSPLGMFS